MGTVIIIPRQKLMVNVHTELCVNDSVKFTKKIRNGTASILHSREGVT